MTAPRGSLLLALAMITPMTVAASGDDACGGPTVVAAVARTDHQPSGNRVVSACGLHGRGAPVDVDLGAVPAWLLPDPSAQSHGWIVAFEDGSIAHVAVEGSGTSSVVEAYAVPLAAGEPPVAVSSANSEVVTVRSALSDDEDAIPWARAVEDTDGTIVTLTGPTDRYAHGVLGDTIEAASFDIDFRDGTSGRVSIGGDAVIESNAAMIADITGDGSAPEILVTLSDAAVGARLVAFATQGENQGGRVAESDPIGLGYRWMHLIGVGATGPSGETEVIAVKTPHIGGIVEAYRLMDGELRLVASKAGYSSHGLGSPNLDMAVLADVDADGRLDVVVPTQDMRTVAVLSRRGDGFDEIATYPLEGSLATNIAATTDGEGRLVLAVGTSDGRLRILR